MKAFALTGIRETQMITVEDPVITKDTDVIIKMKVAGVCGSDIHYYTKGRIGSQIVNYPFTIGHEGAGEVVETGKSVTKVKKGDRVAIDPAMPCFNCDQCLSGRSNTCRNLKFLGVPGQSAGLLSEYIKMPENSCIPVSDKLSYDEAAISEPLAIGLYAVNKSLPWQSTKVGILGFGPIGMSVLLSAQARGATSVYVTEKLNPRIEMALKCGAKWAANPDKINVEEEIAKEEPLLLDVVFECCGKQEAFDNAINILKPGGKLMIAGIPEFDKWIVDADITRRKEISIFNVRRQEATTESALELMEQGIIDVNLMPTHRFPFKDAKEAFDLVAGYRDGVMKAMIYFD